MVAALLLMRPRLPTDAILFRPLAPPEVDTLNSERLLAIDAADLAMLLRYRPGVFTLTL
jgi:hypothetical protein